MAYIGTSGWMYDDWEGRFYPEGMASDAKLTFYAETFETVEVNNTFYQLPTTETVEGWAKRTPDAFVFVTKMSRYVTHQKNLLDPQDPVGLFLDRVEHLGDKLGPILVQLPPHWHVNVERLRSFVEFIPKRHRYAFEFRHESWYNDNVFGILEDHGCAFCIHDHEDAPSPEMITADFVYVRFHGAHGDYSGSYSPEVLASWADRLSNWGQQGLDIYAFFNNDWHAHAINNAQHLRELLTERQSGG